MNWIQTKPDDVNSKNIRYFITSHKETVKSPLIIGVVFKKKNTKQLSCTNET